MIITKKAIVEKACKNGVQSGRTSLKQDLNQINLSMCQVLNVSPEIWFTVKSQTFSITWKYFKNWKSSLKYTEVQEKVRGFSEIKFMGEKGVKQLPTDIFRRSFHKNVSFFFET